MVCRTRVPVVLVACTLAIVLAACTSAAPTGDAQVDSLDGTEWVLVSLLGGDLVQDTNLTLAFADRRISGFGGCNAFHGDDYEVAPGGAVRIGMMAITLQACVTPPGIMPQESTYLDALRHAASYRVTEDRLEFDNAAGDTTLVFSWQRELDMDPADLVGSEWRLLSWDGGDLVEGSVITIAFAENEVRGSAGCRGYSASYLASGDDIRFPLISMTEWDCIGPEALRVQEGEYTTSLEKATHYRLGDEQLEILTARGETLVFAPLAKEGIAHQGTTWALAAFVEEETTTPPLLGSEISLTFEGGTLADFGAVEGSAGCNSYQARYAFGPALAFETVVVTEMACISPAGVMEQEQRYLNTLRDVTVHRFQGKELWLETKDGRALVFAVKE